MKQILVFGAGMVCRPLLRYLLARPDYRVLVCALDVSRAEPITADHPRGRARTTDVTDEAEVDRLVADADVVVSLLPSTLNPLVARACIRHRKHFVNTSYVSPEMQALDDDARRAGVGLVCETGLDPGIDHMSAAQIIHRLQHLGGRITHFASCCGGLPARDSNTNPWGYKFSWFPRGVILAGRNPARFRFHGQDVRIPGEQLFSHHWPYEVEGEGMFEIYPNRDALAYEERYRLQGIESMFRGTIRYPGWCSTMKASADLGLFDLEERDWSPTATYADVALSRVPPSAGGIIERVAGFLGLSPDDEVVARLEWAGLLSDRPVKTPRAAPIDVFVGRLHRLMTYGPAERDLVLLRHVFFVSFPDGRTERIVSTLVATGDPFGDSAMAKTVSLPAAIATHLLLRGTIDGQGITVPVTADLYDPLLSALSNLGIVAREWRTRTWKGPFSA